MAKRRIKYNIILKTDRYQLGRFVRHTTSNLLKYLEYANKEFPNWTFFTVYDFYTREELEKFKRSKKEYKVPTSAHL